jgi:hypothetical protein
VLATEVFSPLGHTTSPLCSGYCGDGTWGVGGGGNFRNFFPWLALNHNPPDLSQVAKILGMSPRQSTWDMILNLQEDCVGSMQNKLKGLEHLWVLVSEGDRKASPQWIAR